jgi:dephospho-CoA kinase
MSRPLRIGLTGGIGSGKSTIADLFIKLGVPVYDADIITRQLTAPGQPALTEIRTVFGESVLAKDGALDRAVLRQRVFNNPDERHKLEAILHPRVYHTLEQLTEQVTGTAYVVWVVPLLLETDAADRVDRVLVVDCPEHLQVARASTRSGLDAGLTQQIMQQQLDRAERLKRADDILDNDGDLDKAKQQVDKLHLKYMELAANYNSEFVLPNPH